MDKTLVSLKRRLEKAELEHLRSHAAMLAQSLESAKERADDAEAQADFYCQQHTDLIRSLTDRGEEIGMTIDGQVGPIAKPFSLDVPQLAEGETYVATLFDAEEHKGYHLIMLPGDNDAAPWEKQMAWAKRIGGELPTRVEQSLLFAKLKLSFKEAAYWSGTESSVSGHAWFQTFSHGSQGSSHMHNELRARAVRRLPI